MSVKKIGDSVIVTGDDIYKHLMGNGRNEYSETCSFCRYEDVDDERCEECSVINYPDHCCSCHINPPCSYCVENGFEVSPYLINYEHAKNRNRKWECYKGTKEVFEKLKQLEADGLKIVAEILTTGEIAIYIESKDSDEAVDITTKADFKEDVNKMILGFKKGGE